MNRLKQILIGGLLTLLASNAMALVSPPITGVLEMTGSATLLKTKELPRYDIEQTISAAEAPSNSFVVDFTRNKFITTSANGDFAGASRIGDIQSFLLDPFMGPIADFLSIDDFSFALTDIEVGRDFGRNAKFLSIAGNGILSASGFADTDATWRLSANNSGGSLFGWSATLTAAKSDVPEPGILALLSLGLITMVVRRKISK